MKKTITALAVALSLSCALVGCATPSQDRYSPNDAQRISEGVDVRHDEFKKQTVYRGPSLIYSIPGYYLPDKAIASLMALKLDNDEKMVYLVSFSDVYFTNGWRNYEQAYDSDGNKFEVTKVDHLVNYCGEGGCSYGEIVSLRVTQDYLAAHTQSGAKFKVSGSGGETIFIVSGPYIEGFLKVTTSN